MEEAACADAMIPMGLARLCTAGQMPHISAKSEMRIASSGLPDFGMSMCIAALKLQQHAEALACVNIPPVQIVHRMPNTYHLLPAVRPHWSHIGFDMLHRIGKLDHVPRVVAPVQFHREISVRTELLADNLKASRISLCVKFANTDRDQARGIQRRL